MKEIIFKKRISPIEISNLTGLKVLSIFLDGDDQIRIVVEGDDDIPQSILDILLDNINKWKIVTLKTPDSNLESKLRKIGKAKELDYKK